ncbi:zinc-binding alcohol dehydrogenase family protein [Microbacterium sp. P07]|uniref:quinone oxidoreductase family protein n=1 Tax=Microbacterium sp. P07 TaxID=3366952 RepID=UPI0037472984
MRAIISDHGTPTFVDRPEPTTGPAQVRVRTHAVALNNADLTASGDAIAGFEFAGIVEAAGDGVPQTLIGRRVMGIAEGAFAEVVAADYRHILTIPEGLAFADAAALPTALSTEYGALRRAGLRDGDTVLITAATSGIALVGLQVAQALGAGVVIGTTRSAGRVDLLRRAGVDHVVVLEGDVILADRVRELTGGDGADVVLDHVSGPGLGDAIDAARKGGAVVSVGRVSGPTAEINLFRLAQQGIALRSVSYGLNPPETIGHLMAGVTVDLMEDVAVGRIRPIIDVQVPFRDAGRAYERLGSGTAEGKVVLTLS